MSARKIYSRDFKLKVLEYYFKHGGDKKFGIKAKTAHHFCIDHKTLTRMLCNTDIVKIARRIMHSKKSLSATSCKLPKPPSLKLMGQTYGGIKEVGVDASSYKSTASSPGSSKSLYSPKKGEPTHGRKPSASVPVIELPEDPDFSLLKKAIESSASATANIAKLLVTGTNEVKKIITNECDLIFECKVCRSLFRSVINFLAHKRVYCQEEYANVKTSFHKDTELGVSSESSTVIVEPEPPPSELFAQDWGGSSNQKELKIDQIASRLSKCKRKGDDQDISSSTNTGSSHYFNKLEQINAIRKSVSSDCTVILQDIAGVSSAVYQTFISPNESKCLERKPQELVRQGHQRKRSEPVQLDADGKVVKKRGAINSSKGHSPIKELKLEEQKGEVFSCSSCTRSFTSKKQLDDHVEDEHGIERTVYTCPICSIVFLSIWGCVKHLIRTHKKKKHQRERLKHVICSRAYTKMFTTKDMANHTHKTVAQLISKRAEKRDEENKEVAEENTEVSKEVALRVSLHAEGEPSKPVRTKPTMVLPQICPRCGEMFQTATAMGAHLQYCSFTSLPNALQSETPEKKIAIQIRKDYKKDSAGSCSNVPDKITQKNIFEPEIGARIKDICIVNKLYCIPCKKKYNTITVLKRHAAQHLGWTRFSCVRCPFRSYEKYMCVQHCLSIHKASEQRVEMMIVNEDKLGKFQYHLTSNKCYSSISENNSSSKFDFEVSSVKSDYLQNGDYSSSSEYSASIVSDDSISFKSELENQDLENANEVYRELIENVDLSGEHSSAKSGIGSVDKAEREMRVERPQRTRKSVEQKDFVYESLRPLSSSNRCEDDLKFGILQLPALTPDLEHAVSHKRKSVVQKEPLKKRGNSKLDCEQETVHKSCNGRESPSEVMMSSVKEEPCERTPCIKDETEVKKKREDVIDKPSKEGATAMSLNAQDNKHHTVIIIKENPDLEKPVLSEKCKESLLEVLKDNKVAGSERSNIYNLKRKENVDTVEKKEGRKDNPSIETQNDEHFGNEESSPRQIKCEAQIETDINTSTENSKVEEGKCKKTETLSVTDTNLLVP